MAMTNKESLNDVSKVVDRTALIENIMNQIIENFSSPRKEARIFFWTVLLDSSVISLGAKVKIIMAIAQEMDFKINPSRLHQLIALRNAFAHHSLNSHQVLYVHKDRSKDKVESTLHVLSQSGKVNEKTRNEALNEFNKLFKTGKEILLELNNSVRMYVDDQQGGQVK